MTDPLPDMDLEGQAAVEHLRRRLRALEAGRRALLDALPSATAEVDAAGRVVACNWRFAALCGAAEVDLAGRPLASLPLTGARVRRRPLPPPGEGELVIATELGDEPAQAADERFRMLCEAAPIGIFLTDARGRFVYHNPRWLELTGMTQEEGLGHGWTRAVHPDDRAALLNDWRRTVASGGGPWSRRHRLLTASGEIRWVRAWAAPLRGRDGELRGYVGTVADITERVRAEEALQASEERLRQVVENMPVLIVAHDEQGIAAWNRECERVTGYAAAEIIGNPQGPQLLYPDPEYFGRMYDEWRRRGGLYRDWEWRLTAKDGTERIVSWSSLSDPHPIPGWLSWAVGVEVTGRKRAEDERAALERKLHESRRLESLGALAGGVAHDFNNLLTGVIGFASLARQEAPEGAAQRDYLDRVVESARRAAELSGQMLAYSGRGRFVVEPLDLSQAVRGLGALLRTSVSPKAALELQLADGLPPVQADVSQVRQLVLNLVLNASEALGERGGAVAVLTGAAWRDREDLSHTYLDDHLPEGEYVFIEVADTGSGMDAATLLRVFEPFFTTKFTGRGLGLAAVLGIVRGHRGAIELASEVGRGTTVRVWLPRAPQGEIAPPRPAMAAPGGAVLFVDDEPALCDLAVRTLRPAGFEALTAGDGREALKLLHGRPDVRAVVLDLTMPGPDADETLRQLRQLRPDVPIILSSGYGEAEARRHFGAGDLTGFLQKPYRPHELIDKIRQALA
jgi:PAS domain S-box-containing protein